MTGIAWIARIRQRPRLDAAAWLRRAQVVAAVALTAASVAFTVAYASSDDRIPASIVNGLLVGVPLAVGLLTRAVEPDDRFSRLLIAAGALFALTALAQSPDELVYTLGRLAAWLAVPMTLYLILVFPSGRLVDARDRWIVIALLFELAVLFVPTVLFSQFPTPAPWTTCDSCPGNALALTDWGVIDAVVRPVRETALALITAAVALSLHRRALRAGALLRSVLEPAVAIAGFLALVLAVYEIARAVPAEEETLELLGWIDVLCLPAVAIAFAAGLMRRRLRVAAILQRLTLGLRAPASAPALQDALARALEDPSLRIVFWAPGHPGRWVDEAGRPASLDGHDASRVTEVIDNGRRVAAVITDASLAPEPSLVRAAAAYALVVLENSQLITHLRASLHDLEEAEERTASVAADERRRIERDLHDGAQQRLLALRMNLSLLSERLSRRAPETEPEFAELGTQIEHAIEELRGLARGAQPPVLAEHGLTEALRVAGREAAIPVVVEATGVERYAPEIEAAVYFACTEALQNAAKHAHGATCVEVWLQGGDAVLRFAVTDNGEGFRRTEESGAGLRNIVARVLQAGGQVEIISPPGAGTRVGGTVPVGPARG